MSDTDYTVSDEKIRENERWLRDKLELELRPKRFELDQAPSVVSESCGSCRFFIAHSNDVNGQCRRRSPMIVNGPYAYEWPVVDPEEWCGEYEPKKEIA